MHLAGPDAAEVVPLFQTRGKSEEGIERRGEKGEEERRRGGEEERRGGERRKERRRGRGGKREKGKQDPMEDRRGGDGGEEEKKKERSEGKERRESRKMIDAFPDILYMYTCNKYVHTHTTDY